MKKLLVGCLIVAVVCAVLLAVGGYFIYRAASPLLEDARAYVSRASELGQLGKQIKNTAAHTPPATGELTEPQVQRFVRVQESVRTALGHRFDEIEAKYQHLKGNATSAPQPSITEMIGALADMANVFVDARRFQVAALNEQNFSQDEYSWVRDRVFQAAGLAMVKAIDLKKLEDAVRTGTGIEDIRAPAVALPEVPEKNRELVKPHLGRVDEWIPLAFFGL